MTNLTTAEIIDNAGDLSDSRWTDLDLAVMLAVEEGTDKRAMCDLVRDGSLDRETLCVTLAELGMTLTRFNFRKS
jgi:hypothetical protein